MAERDVMRILVGVNGGSEQTDALALAARLARVEGGRLILAHVYPWSRLAERVDPEYEAALRAAAGALLETAREQLGVPCETRLLAGVSAPRALQDLARDERADLLIVGSFHGGRLRRAALGGVGERLLSGAPCPVAVAPRGYDATPGPLQDIAVAYDGGAEANAALEWAGRLAERSGASLTVLRAFDAVPVATYPGLGVLPDDEITLALREEAERSVGDALQRLPADVRGSGRVVEGPVGQALAEAAGDSDLLVAGGRGYGPVGALLLGSVSRTLIHEAACPAVVLPRTAAAHDSAAVGAGAEASR
jgi:nucleotide-binding universal stress UspA family protein